MLKEVTEIDVQEVTLLCINHYIVRMPVTKAEHVARNAVASRRSNENIPNLAQALLKSLQKLDRILVFLALSLFFNRLNTFVMSEI